MSKDKKYGLIVPDGVKSQRPVFQATRNIFGDDSESDDEPNKKPVLLRPSDNINRQAKIAQTKAIVEDPTVFQYDEVYEEMKIEKEEKKEKLKDKKPRYIENLLKTANKRKIENERRIERQIQKERELEGDEFADKEVFVTSAYKKKLEEISLEEEKERREEYLETIGDVTKQQDLGGFYRHLYEQKLGPEKNKNLKDSTSINESKLKNVTEKEVSSHSEKQNNKKQAMVDASKKRNYRKRKSSIDIMKQLSEGEIDESDEEINRLNLADIKKAKTSKQNTDNIDADSDFSIDESSDDDGKHEIKQPNTVKKSESLENIPEITETVVASNDNNDKKQDTTTEDTEVKPKVDIWKKRTVGEVFEQALKRYYERKASRGV